MVYDLPESTEKIQPATVSEVTPPSAGLASTSLRDMQALFSGSQYGGGSEHVQEFTITGLPEQQAAQSSNLNRSGAARAGSGQDNTPTTSGSGEQRDAADTSAPLQSGERQTSTDSTAARPGEAALSAPERRIVDNLARGIGSHDIAVMRDALSDFSRNLHSLSPDQVDQTVRALQQRVAETNPGLEISLTQQDQPSGEYAISHDLLEARMISHPGPDREWVLDMNSNGDMSARERSGRLLDNSTAILPSHAFAAMTTGRDHLSGGPD